MAWKIIEAYEPPSSKEILANSFKENFLVGPKSNKPNPADELVQQTFNAGVRNVARGGIKAGEAALGLPGDISQGALSLTNLGIEKVLGAESPFPTETPLPTSESIHKNVNSVVGRFLPEKALDPQTPFEKFADDTVQDFVRLIVPIGGAANFSKAAKVAGLGNASSFLLQQVGAPKAVQEGVKMGTMFTTSMAMGLQGDKGFKTIIKNLPKDEKGKYMFAYDSIKDLHDTIGKTQGLSIVGRIFMGQLPSAKDLAKEVGGRIGSQAVLKATDAIMSSKELQKSLGNVFVSAAKENKANMLKSAQSFDSKLQKAIEEPRAKQRSKWIRVE